ncbi:DUF4870 domain-containing protein [Actomonas aquatica]|uniref:DUF4870 domain-containing protein n=1 Tax=Actomonas aquatica TaxID=2866162 RepID=A0ABZ1C999_9BACT|nr:DUF4870 domain-containing protein [Opitutus sp. WL0086]WRQ87818.1 DUF4870 domain-containing protein [Opitutus sp. WL0086]
MNAPVNVTPVESSHRLLNILSHGAWFLSAPILIPLVVYLVTKDDHTTVPAHAAEAFNFHLSWTIWCLLCVPLILLFGLGSLLIFLLGIAAFVLVIIAIVKAANDELYRYPLTIRFFNV